MEENTRSHDKKNWKSYFWEFLMLFLAVSCGFLAESYRTNLDDKEIEKRNIESYISSIQKDSVKLNRVISGNQDKIKLDRFIKCNTRRF